MINPLLPLGSTVLALVMFLQAPVPQPAPQPPAAQPTTPAVPMVPILPKDPSTMKELLHAAKEEDDINKEATTFWNDGNKKLAQMQAQRDAYEKIVQDEIADIKKQEGWGAEVTYNRATGKFEKPLKHAAEKTEEKK